jgi:hypothetical protein
MEGRPREEIERLARERLGEIAAALTRGPGTGDTTPP